VTERSLPFLPAPDAYAAFAVERADLLLERTRKFISNLPWFIDGPTRAALLAASQYLHLRGLDLLDPLSWKKRGFDLSRGLGFWANETHLVAIAGVGHARDVDAYLRSVLKADKVRFVVESGFTVAYDDAQSPESVLGGFGVIGEFAWLSLGGPRERLAALSTYLKSPPEDLGVPARTLLESGAPAEALGMVLASSDPLSCWLHVEDKSLKVSFEMPDNEQFAKTLGFLCRKADTRRLAMRSGALAVLCGFDLGEIIREAASSDGKDARDTTGVGVLALHDLAPDFGAMLTSKVTLDDVLSSEKIHASLWVWPDHETRWRGWVEEEVRDTNGRIEGSGADAEYVIPIGDNIDKANAPAAWFTFERGALLGSLGKTGLAEARDAARGWGGGFVSSIDDDEIRDMLLRGEPFFHIQVAELAERLSGVVLALVKEGSIGKGLGARELLQLLRRIEDASGALMLSGEPRLRGWVRLRLR
jgi:hypothetical protein